MNIAVRLDRYTNGSYEPGSLLRRVVWYIASYLFLNTAVPWPYWFKSAILRCFGAKVGIDLLLKPRVNIKYPWFLKIGDHVWVGERVWIDNLAPVHIENHVCISQGAYLLTGNHDYKKSTFDLRLQPVVIEQGAWVGAMAIVAPGVTIRSHSVLTAGSVATSDTEPYTIYQGNPAQVLRRRVME